MKAATLLCVGLVLGCAGARGRMDETTGGGGDSASRITGDAAHLHRLAAPKAAITAMDTCDPTDTCPTEK
jgi:hypothetical protein